MTLAEIAKYRLSSQQLLQTDCTNAAAMVTWFGAMQAQEYAHTKWSIGMRLPGAQEADIEQEIAAGHILRTHVLRPTWHFVAAADIRWMLHLTAPRVHAVNAFMHRKLELAPALFHTCNDLLIKILEGGKQYTRTALNEVFKQNGILVEGFRLSYIMMQAELDGLVCSGPRQGNQFTYALLEEQVPQVASKTKEEALAELTKRYFTSRGPASLKDFATWSGLTLTDCKKGLEMLQSHFARVKTANEDLYYAPQAMPDEKAFENIYLLPLYDEYIMGYKNRNAMLVFQNSIDPKPIFKFDNTILQEGQVIGTWKRVIHKNSIDVESAFFKPLDKYQQALLEQALKRFNEFMGLRVNT